MYTNETKTEITAAYETTPMNTTDAETKSNEKKKQVQDFVTYTIDH